MSKKSIVHLLGGIPSSALLHALERHDIEIITADDCIADENPDVVVIDTSLSAQDLLESENFDAVFLLQATEASIIRDYQSFDEEIFEVRTVASLLLVWVISLTNYFVVLPLFERFVAYRLSKEF